MARKTESSNSNVEHLTPQARIKRQTDCSEAINKVLADHNCELQVFVQVGDVARPINEVLGLPMLLNAVAKEVEVQA